MQKQQQQPQHQQHCQDADDERASAQRQIIRACVNYGVDDAATGEQSRCGQRHHIGRTKRPERAGEHVEQHSS